MTLMTTGEYSSVSNSSRLGTDGCGVPVGNLPKKALIRGSRRGSVAIFEVVLVGVATVPSKGSVHKRYLHLTSGKITRVMSEGEHTTPHARQGQAARRGLCPSR